MSGVHDLSLARRYGTHAVLMDGGRCIAKGCCADVLTRENLQAVYDMDVFGWMWEMYETWKDEKTLFDFGGSSCIMSTEPVRRRSYA